MGRALTAMRARLALLLSLALTANAWAATPTVLTWEDCVRLAALHNPDLLSSQKATDASRSLYKESFNGILPRVTFSNSYTDSSNVLGESKQWALEGTASLDLVNVASWVSIQSASASLQQSQANYRVSAATTLLNLYQAFAAVLYAQEEIQVNQNIRDTWKLNSEMIGLRYKSGSESKGNNMNTQAQYLQAQVGVEQASRDLRVAQQKLSQVLGMDDFQALEATGTWNAAPVPTPHPDLSLLLGKIPQIQSQEATVDIAHAAVRSARSAIFPTVSLNYNRGTVGANEFPSDPFWSFTGTASIPLFSGGLTSTYYASQAAERSYEKALQDLRSLRNQTLTSLESAWSGYAHAQDQIHVQKAFLEADAQRKAESDVLYKSGLLPFQEWIIIVEDYVNFQTSYLRSEQNLILAEAQWRFATGQQLGEGELP